MLSSFYICESEKSIPLTENDSRKAGIHAVPDEKHNYCTTFSVLRKRKRTTAFAMVLLHFSIKLMLS
jgi:hypothetical protein